MKNRKTRYKLFNLSAEAALARNLGLRLVKKRIVLETKVLQEPTLVQSIQRLKFGLVNRFLSVAQDTIKLGYAYAYKKRALSELNLAVRFLLKPAMLGTYPDCKLDFSRMPLSYGNEQGNLSNPELAISENGRLRISWSEQLYYYNYIQGETVFFIYNERTERGISYCNRAKNDEYFLEIESCWKTKGDRLHCWIFVIDRGRKKNSCCDYMTITV